MLVSIVERYSSYICDNFLFEYLYKSIKIYVKGTHTEMPHLKKGYSWKGWVKSKIVWLVL
jgi:hypothetical protein